MGRDAVQPRKIIAFATESQFNIPSAASDSPEGDRLRVSRVVIHPRMRPWGVASQPSTSNPAPQELASAFRALGVDVAVQQGPNAYIVRGNCQSEG